MPRRLRRGLAMAALLVVVPMTAVLVPAAAQAHGAPQDPVSRAFACGPEGGARRSMPACQAAIAAGGSLDAWDSIRVANVAGRDRTVIPDGKLCSGGLDRYRGLDLPRVDWPSTNLTPGATYSFSYRATIGHPGTFRMYLTKTSYDPTHPLRWADLDTAPFLTAKDPPLQGSAYVMKGRLPAGRTGRQLIYTIWQNSGPDTYYSCSDVVFAATAPPAAGAGVGATKATGTAEPTAGRTSGNAVPLSDLAPVADSRPGGGGGLPLAVFVAVIAAVAVVAMVGAVLRRRRPRSR